MSQRSKIIQEARSWIGTKFHHQGRIKKSKSNEGGVDCLGLIIGVADALDIKIKGKPIRSLDCINYSKIPDGNFLKKNFDDLFEVTDVTNARSGDIALFKFKDQPQHVGFIIKEDENLSLLHCYMQARGVVEHKLDILWKNRLVDVYKIF